MIWAYYIELSDHMWNDASSKSRYLYLKNATSGDMYGYETENHIEVEAWDEIVKYLAETKFNTLVIDLGDAVKWESHPEIAAPNAWTKEFMKKKLDEIRALGITPIPKMNFSTCHDAWLKEYCRMVGSGIYRKVCADLISEACELFGYPPYFHLGLDEEASEECHLSREAIIIRGEKLLWEDYHFLMDAVMKNGARPWMWADYCWDRFEIFTENVSNEVLISNWYYSHFVNHKTESWISRSMNAYERLNEIGYDQVPTASTCGGVNTNAYETLVHCKKYIDGNHLLGYMTAPWTPTMKDELLFLKNDAFRLYRGRTLVYPETLGK